MPGGGGCIFSSLPSQGSHKCPPCAFKQPEILLPSPPGVPAVRFPSVEHPHHVPPPRGRRLSCASASRVPPSCIRSRGQVRVGQGAQRSKIPQ